ncbi:unnamed protein product [Porites evermanni]|uniref:Uncharacterized protein n=1 Tax=Porites evermanni TaxID=104178 RepID=A0ABN8SRB0_9CNID|nr:unnamed protein product [Porites evermanni]
MEAQTHQVTTGGRPPSLSISSAQEDHRRRSSTNTSQHSSAYAFSPDRTERRKPSSIANPFLSSPNRKVSSNVSPRSEGFTTDPKHRGQADVLPTYRMEPLPDRKFRPHVVKRIMDEAFEESLDALRSYDSVKCRALTTQLCEDIKQRVKWLNYERCKLVCLVHIGSVSGQGMRVASQCLWDQNVDNFASTSYRKGDIFAVALLFAVYKE